MTRDPNRTPPCGLLFRRIGGGFITLHVGHNGQCTARIMADRYDIGFVSGWMPNASFWDLVDTTA